MHDCAINNYGRMSRSRGHSPTTSSPGAVGSHASFDRTCCGLTANARAASTVVGHDATRERGNSDRREPNPGGGDLARGRLDRAASPRRQLFGEPENSVEFQNGLLVARCRSKMYLSSPRPYAVNVISVWRDGDQSSALQEPDPLFKGVRAVELRIGRLGCIVDAFGDIRRNAHVDIH